jgi:hypothetical protein
VLGGELLLECCSQRIQLCLVFVCNTVKFFPSFPNFPVEVIFCSISLVKFLEQSRILIPKVSEFIMPKFVINLQLGTVFTQLSLLVLFPLQYFLCLLQLSVQSSQLLLFSCKQKIGIFKFADAILVLFEELLLGDFHFDQAGGQSFQSQFAVLH